MSESRRPLLPRKAAAWFQQCGFKSQKLLGFMSVIYVKIIANVPRVTSGEAGNGAIYTF